MRVCLILLLLQAASAVEPTYERVPTGPVLQWHISLGQADSTPQLLVTTTGQTVTAFAPLRKMFRGAHGTTGLTYSGGRLQGVLTVREAGLGELPTLLFPLALDVQGAATAMSGTWQRRLSKGVNDDGVVPAAQDQEGSVSGTVLSEAELATINAFSGKGSWDSYVGTNQNFTSVDLGIRLVDSLAKARPLWAASHMGGMQIGDPRHGLRLMAGPVGGAATPLVANGKVYTFHTEPVGDVIQSEFADFLKNAKRMAPMAGWTAATGQTVEEVMGRFSLHADDVMSCYDAATGKLLWRTRWAGDGLNLVGHKTGFSNHTGAIGNGKVFVFGSMGEIRGLDAETGKQLWSTPIPGYSANMRDIKTALAANCPSRKFAHGLNVAGDVVLAPSGIGGCSMVGLDVATGKVLWTGGVLGKAVTPLRWSAGGRHFAIGASEEKVECIDAKTGAVAWTISEKNPTDFTPSIEDDLLLTGAGCYRMTANQATKLWSIESSGIVGQGGPFPSRMAGIIYRGVAWIRGGPDVGLIARRASDGQVLKQERSRAPHAEAYTMGSEGMLIYNHEAQHHNNVGAEMLAVADDPTKLPPLGKPSHPQFMPDLSYVVPVMYPIVEGRIFMRTVDTLICLDLRAQQ